MGIFFMTFNYIKLPSKIFLVLFLNTLYQPLASAEAIDNLQKNASIAYEQMIQAKRSAETLAKDAAFAEKQLTSIKQKLTAAEREVEITRKKSDDAKISAEQATNRWKQATDALADAWEKAEKK